MPINKPKLRVRTTPENKINKEAKRKVIKSNWLKRARFFARGGHSKVYSTWFSKHPARYLWRRSDVVKIRYAEPNFERVKGKQEYYIMKISHALFPEHFPEPIGVSFGDKYYEIHIKRVPVHKELQKYMQRLAESNSKGHEWYTPEMLLLDKAYEKNQTKHFAVREKLMYAGLIPHDENSTNISFANGRVIFFEPDIINMPSVERYAKTLPQKQRKKVLRLIKLFYRTYERNV